MMVDHLKSRRNDDIRSLYKVWTNSTSYLVKNLLDSRDHIRGY